MYRHRAESDPNFPIRRIGMTKSIKLWRNRKERKEWARRLQSEDPGLDVVHPQAAGIDVGSSSHYVAVRPERDEEPVRRFDCFTADLYRLVDWLKGNVKRKVFPSGIRTDVNS
jgi:hypothetical protein